MIKTKLEMETTEQQLAGDENGQNEPHIVVMSSLERDKRVVQNV